MSELRSFQREGYTFWAWETPLVRGLFVGRGPDGERSDVLQRIRPGGPPEVSWAKQVHGRDTLEARPGPCGEADALWTDRPSLALAIATADCVPVILASQRRIAAAHAGWRGLAGGVLEEAAGRLEGTVTAWIGPAIGPCCYEVGVEVAEPLVTAADDSISRRGPGERPRVDLKRAAAIQLRRLGIEIAGVVDLCTRCHPDLLFSYRREGSRAGRNLAFAWR